MPPKTKTVASQIVVPNASPTHSVEDYDSEASHTPKQSVEKQIVELSFLSFP